MVGAGALPDGARSCRIGPVNLFNEAIALLPPVVLFIGVVGLIWKLAFKNSDQRRLEKLLAEQKKDAAAKK